MHTDKHDKWDQGGYCNNMVTDHDGSGTTCGYRKAPPALHDEGEVRAREARRYEESIRATNAYAADLSARLEDAEAVVADLKERAARAWEEGYDIWALSPAGDQPRREDNPYRP